MIGKTNVLYGAGGPGNPESGMAMLVTYPEGSICTCTDGEKSLRALDDSGACVFYIPSAGDWTVSASEDGAMIDKKTIAVTSGYQDAIELKASLTRQYLTDKLVSWEDDQVQTIAEYAFYMRKALKSVKTAATNVGEGAFRDCSSLEVVDFTGVEPVTFGSYAFLEAIKLKSLIVRSTNKSSIVSNALNDTAIYADEGCIYVPASLVDTYKTATNWSKYEKNIYPIDSYPVTNFETISDSWSEIFAAEDNGTYSTKYSVGDTKSLVYNGQNACFQIVAMDTDVRSDGNGKAKITWLSRRGLEQHRMNATATTSGGWAESEARSYIRETCLAKLPSEIQNRIVEVNKTYYDYETKNTLTIADTLWLPSFYEVTGNSSLAETSGVTYPYLYGSISYDSRYVKRVKYGLLSDLPAEWFTRSAGGASSFRYADAYGYMGAITTATYNYMLSIGFCT